MKRKVDVAVIGAGLAGLQCGALLSREGYKVCVVEQHHQIGGCLQTFRRKEASFDTGFHYVGGLDEGQPLHRLFRLFDLLDLPWKRMDEEGFAEVILDGKSWLLPCGYDRFTDYLSAHFPHEREAIGQYVRLLRDVENTIFQSLTTPGANMDYFTTSAWDYLTATIKDPLLRNLLSAASLTMELDREHLPLYVFAQINNSFIRSSWRLEGGGERIARRLAQQIVSNGGTILTGSPVARLTEKEGQLAIACCRNGQEVEADWFISTLHPASTLSLMPDSRLFRNIYRKRMAALPLSYGMFTTHLRLKKEQLPYLNRNLFIHEDPDVWNPSRPPLLVSFYPPAEGDYARQIDLLMPMRWVEVAQWEKTTRGKRGADYLAFKQQKAAQCVETAARHLPGLTEAIDAIYTSTPLTYRDYTGIPQGAAFGVQKDFSNSMGTLIPVQTQVPNLLLSGQHLNLHGVLGVSMTSLLTCAKIIPSLTDRLSSGG